ncbi:uncharacterized protein LOC114266352 [Camellia sinensis]|uniref:uncharacterized protein LOC114266352 n=1 Tax=Camellia sinensis TaxID=4442 RepID=UPI0010365D16|nr:uncharacterized protein LOC114266352 [Camellia sinensis]
MARDSRVAFARVCVEIKATSKLPSYFQIRCEEDAVLVRVEYQGLPSICKHCQIFGHNTDKCVSKQVAQLISLQKTSEDNTFEHDEEWTTIKAKGKRKVGEPDLEAIPESMEVPEPNPVPNSTIVQSLETQETSAGKSSSMEEQISESRVDRFQESVLEITELVIPNAAELLEAVVNDTTSTKEASKPDAPSHQASPPTKYKSSGEGSNNQRKKKRGLNDPSKHKEIKNLVLKENIHVIGVLETKIKQINESKICAQCFGNWPILSNSQPTVTGRVWVCWNNDFCDVQMISMSSQHIFCKINDLATNEDFFATFVYAENKHTLRKILFETMYHISRTKSKFLCVFLGDFNAIRYQQEKVGGSSNWTNDHEEFNTYVNKSELADLSYGGCQFTWANKWGDGAYIATKIDRLLVNESWLDQFPESTASFLPPGISDHSPTVINISVTRCSFKKPFKCFDFWSQHPEFLNTVSNTWDQYIRGVPMFRVCQKLRQLKVRLKLLNKKDFSDFSTRVQASKASLNFVQLKLDKDRVNLVLQVQDREEF